MNKKRNLPVFLAAAVILSALLLAGCQDSPGESPFIPGETQATEMPTTEATVPETEPTEPPPTSPPDGNPDDVTCQGSYTGTTQELVAHDNTVVATIGKEELNNSLLQIYYWMAVNTYREAAHEVAPDFSLPLDVQLCPLEGTAITWQQYFLDQALRSWQSHYAMVQRSKTAVLPLEEAYDRDEALHAKNEVEKAYNLPVLYGYNADYKINEAHQAYLDSLPELLNTLAKENNCPSPAALASRFAGIGTNDTYLLEYARLLNEGYMFMTSLSYYMEPTDEEISAYFEKNKDYYNQHNITTDAVYVNLRQILLIPEEAEIADDGVVTASDESWEACKKAAEALLKKWGKNKTEANFAELAFANSQDTGSSVNGGLYANLSKGQLMEDLDLWCFDGSRKPGDTVIIRTDLGYHILYLCEPTRIWMETAEQDLIARMIADEISKTTADYPMTVDYSAIVLGEPTSEEMLISTSDVLYPDIAHERFTDAPLYFQQDYPNTMYGKYPLVKYGCGVTTMSMLVTYMTDEEWTPPELCELYGSYCSIKGTAHAMFTEVPVDRGFYCKERVYTWSQALKALEDGYMVVTLQHDGYWTAGGHYLLLHNLIEVETEDGKTETRIQVRDSNVKNYKRLTGHAPGHFALSTIPGNAKCYWVYQKKVMNVDSCVRCAEQTADSHAPAALFTEGYVCPKCQTAVNRRDAYIDGCAAVHSLVPEAPVETASEATAPTEVPAATENTPADSDDNDTFPPEDDA